MTVPEPSYITAAEVREQTLIAGLKEEDTIDNANLAILIQSAEDQIDAYVGPQKHHPDDDNDDRVFPRDSDEDLDGYPQVPYQVARACLRQVEWLYTQWYPSRTTDQLPVEHDVQSEDIRADGSYSVDYARGGMDLSAASLCPQARVMLDRFRSRFSQIGVSDPRKRPSIDGIFPPR